MLRRVAWLALLVACSDGATTAPEHVDPPTTTPPEGAGAPHPVASLGALSVRRANVTIAPPRDHHSTLAIELEGRGWLYVFGGTDSWDSLFADIQAAPIDEEGNLGPFAEVGSLPQARAGHATLLVDGHVIVMGGLSGTSGARGLSLDTTAIAKLNADGTLGPWQTGPVLPEAVMHQTCNAVGREIFCVGGRLVGNVTTDVTTRTRLLADGTLAPFERMTPLPVSIGFQQAFVHGARLFVAGGLHRAAPTDDFDRRREILSLDLVDGGDGAWSPAGALPDARNVGAAEVVGDRVFVSSGMGADDAALASISEGIFGEDGALDFRPVAASLSVPRAHIHQTPLYKRWMYFVGGRNDDQRSVGIVDIGTFE